MADLHLYVKEGDSYKRLRVPVYVIRDLVRDRLSQSELDRIHRLASEVEKPAKFEAGSVVVDFSSRTARCFEADLDFEFLEPTWEVTQEKVTGISEEKMNAILEYLEHGKEYPAEHLQEKFSLGFEEFKQILLELLVRGEFFEEREGVLKRL